MAAPSSSPCRLWAQWLVREQHQHSAPEAPKPPRPEPKAGFTCCAQSWSNLFQVPAWDPNPLLSVKPQLLQAFTPAQSFSPPDTQCTALSGTASDPQCCRSGLQDLTISMSLPAPGWPDSFAPGGRTSHFPFCQQLWAMQEGRRGSWAPHHHPSALDLQ